MKIGIIGAGIAGLAAGKELALAGHEVTVIEKTRKFGGRLATDYSGEGEKMILDYGLSWLTAQSADFRKFLAELLEENIINVWQEETWQYNESELKQIGPLEDEQIKYVAPEGMNRIAAYLARWVDILPEVKAGGVTFIGANRRKKRAWMINLTNFNTLEVDAVIVATPAPQAYSVLMTTRDETDSLKLIREIDEIHYEPAWTLMAGYGELESPQWGAVQSQDPVLNLLVNENSKRTLPETALVLHSTGDFARENRSSDPSQVADAMLNSAAEIAGDWAGRPEWSRLHFWGFATAGSSIEKPYMEFSSDGAPFAIVGDYFGGNLVDHAYASGVKLARDWIETYR